METVAAEQLFLLLLMVCSGSPVVLCSFDGNETDRLSLIQFKEAINRDPQQVMTSWNDSNDFCNWEGVSCWMKNPRRVTSLNLDGRGLVGTISPSIRNLTFLNNLSLPNNAFSGQIPPSLGHLRHVRHLYLSNNTLQGEIPDFSNCSKLKALWLDGNGLV